MTTLHLQMLVDVIYETGDESPEFIQQRLTDLVDEICLSEKLTSDGCLHFVNTDKAEAYLKSWTNPVVDLDQPESREFPKHVWRSQVNSGATELGYPFWVVSQHISTTMETL